MAIQTDFKIEDVLCKPLMIHLSSIVKGEPRSSPLWFLYEDQKIWLFGTKKDSFIKRLKKYPKCALSITDFSLERGVLKHVGIRGESSVLDLDSDRLERFVSKYLGNDPKNWNKWFVDHVVNPLDQMVVVILKTTVAKDVSFFKTGPDLAK